MSVNLIKKYFPELSENQIVKLQDSENLYKEWNSKINVISRKDIDFFVERHLLHSLSIVKTKLLENCKTVIDVGTGGGFPGIPLAIAYPNINFTLIDSIGKKINVVNEVISALNLTNVKAFKSRSTDFKGNFDFIISRAVTNFPDFVSETKHLLNKSNNCGIVYLKGGDFDEEISIFKSQIIIFEVKNYFTEEFFETKKIIYFK